MMSNKSGIYMDQPTGIYLYAEALVEGESPAYIQVGKDRFKIEIDFDDALHQATVEIPAEVMDKLALAWIKHKGLLAEILGVESISPELVAQIKDLVAGVDVDLDKPLAGEGE